jgi:hypothetical protein
MVRGATDWAAWSSEAVRIMRERNDAWVARWGLAGAAYTWELRSAELIFAAPDFEVVADLCCVGTASRNDGTFMWSWANDALPAPARRGVERIREFGEHNGLPLLTTAEWRGGEPEGKEMVAVAARILDAEGVWIERADDVTLFFTLSHFRTRALSKD